MLDPPSYPDIDWKECFAPDAARDELHVCVSLENAKELYLYLAAVQRYHIHIEEVCPRG